MKINKLYTLSQFVDKINSEITIDTQDYEVRQKAYQIFNYNNFLKQTLTKEMSVGDKAIFKEFKVPPTYLIQWKVTLFTLAESTKGQLTLKNVEL